MAITKSQKRLALVLLIALGYAGYDLISNTEQYGSFFSFLSPKKETSIPGNETKIASELNQAKEDTIIKINMNWGRDPFFSENMRPPKKSTGRRKPAVKLVLNAITYSGENSIVIINNQILKQGQMIEGYLIEKIYLNKVKLTKAGQTKYLQSE